MKSTRTRQRIISLTCSTATVCDALALYYPKPEPWDSSFPWQWQPDRRSNMTAAERARQLLEKLMSMQNKADK